MSHSNCLLYLVYGPEYFHHEVFFSVVSALSFLRHEPENLDKPEIRIITDRPDLYAGLPVCIDVLDEKTRTEWAGAFSFHWRMRYPCIRSMLQQYERVVLVDGDTFFKKSPGSLFPRVMPGYFLCHKIEERLGDSVQLFLQLQRVGFTHDQDARLFNAGVLGVHRDDIAFLEAPLDLLDRFYPDLGKIYIFEQICVSVAAHGRLHLNTCADVLLHYWSRKTIVRAKIQAWFHKNKDAPLSESALLDLKQIDTSIPRPGPYTRLKIKLVLLFFPKAMRQFAKEILYSSVPCANEFDRAANLAYCKKAVQNALAQNGKECVAAWLEHALFRKTAGLRLASIREMLEQE